MIIFHLDHDMFSRAERILMQREGFKISSIEGSGMDVFEAIANRRPAAMRKL